MKCLPHPWDVYARLQTELAESHHINGRNWGLEAGLDQLLAQTSQLPSEEEVARTVRSEGRKGRYRARLLRAHLSGETVEPSAAGAIAARLALRGIQQKVSADDWALLRAVGTGYAYDEIDTSGGASVNHLRVRVLRLRRRLLEGADDLATSEPTYSAAA